MAWEWSHTPEAYANAYANLQNRPREWLETVWAEWEASEYDTGIGFRAMDLRQYEAALAKAKELPEDTLADAIWERMAEQATCTNGGFEAWACPYGCRCHLVPFDLESQEVA